MTEKKKLENKEEKEIENKELDNNKVETEEIKETKEETIKKIHKHVKGIHLLIYSIVTIIVVLGILIAFSFLTTSKTEYPEITYNNYKFQEIDNLWYFDWVFQDQSYKVALRFNPFEVENVTIKGELDKRFDEREVYLTFDPTSGNFSYQALAAAELSLNLHRAIGITPIAACIVNETDACETRPIITCNNTNRSVIYLKHDKESKLILKGNCMIIQGNKMEMLRIVDRILYQWYKVLDPKYYITIKQ